MFKAILFGGTTEGRELAGFMLEKGIPCLVCVTSDYGSSLVKAGGSLKVHIGRLDESDIIKLIKDELPELVIDATHPYAAVASRNISEACKKTKANSIRVKRQDSVSDGCTVFNNMEKLVEKLDDTEGPVFLSTGSKDLKSFVRLKNHSERLYARVLPSEESIKLCLEAGIKQSHIICMQGPFSKELNAAMFRETGAKILITKESGAAGGFEEKLSAARELGLKVFLLKRPEDSGDKSLEEVKEIIGRL